MKVALAYSGGLDTTVMIKWISQKYKAEVVTVTVNVGQDEDFGEIEKKALESGAVAHYTVDAVKKFAEEYIKRAIRANALYEKSYPLSSALSRPLIAEEVVKVARIEGCDALAHGCTGKGNDQLRFDATFSALAPDLKIIAPVREWNMSRDEEIKYALEHNLPIDPVKSRFSFDENLWGRSIEAAELEDPWTEPPAEAFKLVKPLDETPDVPEELVIGFEDGVPVKLNGVRKDLVEIIKELNEIGGKHGYGIVDHVEDRVVGLKSREVYEVPAALLLINSHIDLEKMFLGRRMQAVKQFIDSTWAEIVYSGFWADPLRKALDAFIEASQKGVTGEVRVRLFKGSMRIVGRSGEKPLYSRKYITYASGSVFDQKAGEGFSKLWSLETLLSSLREKE